MGINNILIHHSLFSSVIIFWPNYSLNLGIQLWCCFMYGFELREILLWMPLIAILVQLIWWLFSYPWKSDFHRFLLQTFTSLFVKKKLYSFLKEAKLLNNVNNIDLRIESFSRHLKNPVSFTSSETLWFQTEPRKDLLEVLYEGVLPVWI